MVTITLSVTDDCYDTLLNVAKFTGIQVNDCPVEILLQNAFRTYYYLFATQLCDTNVVFLSTADMQSIEREGVLHEEQKMLTPLVGDFHRAAAINYLEQLSVEDISFTA